jgi:acetyl esterase/lipase
MDIEKVAPDLRQAVRRMPALPLGNRVVRTLVRAAMRLVPGAPTEGVSTCDVAAGPGLRVHVPAERGDAALLWIHGGGFLIGAPKQDDRFCGATARALGMVVVAAGYRLAPQHRFAEVGQDCFAAWQWMQAHAGEFGFDVARMAIGGMSAGGGLAAGLVQRVRDAGGVQPKAQWLFCPMLDDRTAARCELDAVRHLVWNNQLNAVGWSALLGQPPGSAAVPDYAVPARRENLAGLPATWVGVGDIDLFCEEDRAYAERLRAAGVEVTFDLVAGAPHGFEAWAADTAISRDYLQRARDWLAAEVRK